jgi:hypothetical protein
MENASIFYGHLEYFTVNWYIFGMLCQEKSGNPANDPIFVNYSAKSSIMDRFA